jgi:hypothetical protein
MGLRPHAESPNRRLVRGLGLTSSEHWKRFAALAESCRAAGQAEGTGDLSRTGGEESARRPARRPGGGADHPVYGDMANGDTRMEMLHMIWMFTPVSAHGESSGSKLRNVARREWLSAGAAPTFMTNGSSMGQPYRPSHHRQSPHARFRNAQRAVARRGVEE